MSDFRSSQSLAPVTSPSRLALCFPTPQRQDRRGGNCMALAGTVARSTPSFTLFRAIVKAVEHTLREAGKPHRNLKFDRKRIMITTWNEASKHTLPRSGDAVAGKAAGFLIPTPPERWCGFDKRAGCTGDSTRSASGPSILTTVSNHRTSPGSRSNCASTADVQPGKPRRIYAADRLPARARPSARREPDL